MGNKYAKYLRRQGKLFKIGENCSILPSTIIRDPHVRLGNKVHFSSSRHFGHDGVVGMLNHSCRVTLDKVKKIDIRDHVFVGFGAILVPGITFGPDVHVSAGAVVTKGVQQGDGVGGFPAETTGKLEQVVRRLQNEIKTLEWAEIIAKRERGLDPAVEGEQPRRRQMHFYSQDSMGKLEEEVSG